MWSGIKGVSSRAAPAECLRDIIANAARAARHLAGVERERFASSEATVDAVERCIERVCEAVVRLGETAERLMPGHPWAAIRGMGNRLRHAYDYVDPDVVWKTAQERLPEIAGAAERALIRLEAEDRSAETFDDAGGTPK